MSIILYKNYYVTKCIILVGTTSATTTNNEIINYAHNEAKLRTHTEHTDYSYLYHRKPTVYVIL